MGTPNSFFITTCPNCKFKRRAAAQYLGYLVRCSSCRTIYTARDTGVRPIDDPIRYSLEFNEASESADVSEDFDAKRPR